MTCRPVVLVVGWGLCEGHGGACGALGPLFHSPSRDVRHGPQDWPWLCQECDASHQEDWQERWADYYSDQGWYAGEFEWDPPPSAFRRPMREWWKQRTPSWAAETGAGER